MYRLLAKMWGLPGVQAVFDSFNNIKGKEIDVFADLILAAAHTSGIAGADELTIDDAGQWALYNTEKLPEITNELVASLPAQKTDDSAGKQTPATATPAL